MHTTCSWSRVTGRWLGPALGSDALSGFTAGLMPARSRQAFRYIATVVFCGACVLLGRVTISSQGATTLLRFQEHSNSCRLWSTQDCRSIHHQPAEPRSQEQLGVHCTCVSVAHPIVQTMLGYGVEASIASTIARQLAERNHVNTTLFVWQRRHKPHVATRVTW
jgi:hypothetical protein